MPKRRMETRSSPKSRIRFWIQRGISAPQPSENRISWVKLVMGMMPGVMGIVMPRRRQSSTNLK